MLLLGRSRAFELKVVSEGSFSMSVRFTSIYPPLFIYYFSNDEYEGKIVFLESLLPMSIGGGTTFFSEKIEKRLFFYYF